MNDNFKNDLFVGYIIAMQKYIESYDIILNPFKLDYTTLINSINHIFDNYIFFGDQIVDQFIDLIYEAKSKHNQILEKEYYGYKSNSLYEYFYDDMIYSVDETDALIYYAFSFSTDIHLMEHVRQFEAIINDIKKIYNKTNWSISDSSKMINNFTSLIQELMNAEEFINRYEDLCCINPEIETYDKIFIQNYNDYFLRYVMLQDEIIELIEVYIKDVELFSESILKNHPISIILDLSELGLDFKDLKSKEFFYLNEDTETLSKVHNLTTLVS